MKKYIVNKYKKNIEIFTHSKWGMMLIDKAPEQCFHFNSKSVPRSIFLGIFIAFIPMPFQMLLAGALALKIHSNIFLSVALVWISNPVTIPVVWGIPIATGYLLLGDYVSEQASFLYWIIAPASCMFVGLILGTIGWTFSKFYYKYKIS